MWMKDLSRFPFIPPRMPKWFSGRCRRPRNFRRNRWKWNPTNRPMTHLPQAAPAKGEIPAIRAVPAAPPEITEEIKREAIHPETVTEDREPPAVTTGQTHPEQKGKTGAFDERAPVYA